MKKSKGLDIADKIKADIFAKKYSPDKRFPGEHKLAEIYNCSRFTISKVINNLTHEGLLYRKKGAGTYIRINGSKYSQQNNIYGYMYEQMPVANNIMKHLLQAIQEKNSYLLVQPYSAKKFQNQEEMTRNIHKIFHHIKGVIIGPCYTENNFQYIKYFESIGVPLIIYGNYNDFSRNYVTINRSIGIQQAVHFLVNNGVKKNIHFAGNCRPDYETSKISGFKEAVGMYNLSGHTIHPISNSIEGGMQLAEKIISTDTKVEAFICGNDQAAYGILKYYRKKNIPLPYIIGFDDIEDNNVFYDIKYTISHNKEYMAMKLLEILDKIIEDPDYSEKITLPTHFVVREDREQTL